MGVGTLGYVHAYVVETVDSHHMSQQFFERGVPWVRVRSELAGMLSLLNESGVQLQAPPRAFYPRG